MAARKYIVQMWGHHPDPYKVTMSKRQIERLAAALSVGEIVKFHIDGKVMYVNTKSVEIVQYAPL